MLDPCRRKIHDVYISSKSATAEEALKRISELYAIEDEIRGLPESERLAVRQQRSKALLTSLQEWMVDKNGTPSVITVMTVWRRRTITQRKERFVQSVSERKILMTFVKY
ncbi:TPA: transposase [Escherichia coli]|nr:transposase [Escherichia coli]HAX4779401.1 transposase [Escherichia coli]HAX5195985.1 transposase [Escherichia coli]